MTLASVLWGTGKGWGRTLVESLPRGPARGGRPPGARRGLPLDGLTRKAVGALGCCAMNYRFVAGLEREGVPRFPNRIDLMRHALSVAPPEGLLLEFGVYRGESINRLADMAKGRVIYGFDSFEGLPEDWVRELPQGAFSTGGDLPPVRDTVRLVKGLFQDTLGPFLDEHREPAAFVHMDADLMSSTKYVLDALDGAGRLKESCVIQFDDFYGWSNRYRNGDYAAWRASALSRRPHRFLGFVLPPAGEVGLRLGGT